MTEMVTEDTSTATTVITNIVTVVMVNTMGALTLVSRYLNTRETTMTRSPHTKTRSTILKTLCMVEESRIHCTVEMMEVIIIIIREEDITQDQTRGWHLQQESVLDTLTESRDTRRTRLITWLGRVRHVVAAVETGSGRIPWHEELRVVRSGPALTFRTSTCPAPTSPSQQPRLCASLTSEDTLSPADLGQVWLQPLLWCGGTPTLRRRSPLEARWRWRHLCLRNPGSPTTRWLGWRSCGQEAGRNTVSTIDIIIILIQTGVPLVVVLHINFAPKIF